MSRKMLLSHGLMLLLGIGASAFVFDRIVQLRLDDALRTLPRANPVAYSTAPPVAVTTPVPAASADAFQAAAQRALPAVVHILARPEGLRQWVSPSTVSTGSGVILSAEGYIVTNFHVVEGSRTVLVTLTDKSEFEAEVLGTDPSTDLAVLRVQAEQLPAIDFANSDSVTVGQWVMAIGNPFTLNSTVTAGIISARGRNIGSNTNRNTIRGNTSLAIESYLQTDAAVNPGNSGGALVDLQGRLIGINTAIASETGTFQGYSFAIPANLVRKVADDLIRYGAVQRGFLGVTIQDIDHGLARRFDLRTRSGAIVLSLTDKGAAAEAGLQPGDVITAVEGVTVTSASELQEQVANYRPGDRVRLQVLRDGSTRELALVLRNREGTTGLVKAEPLAAAEDPAAELADLSDLGTERLGVALDRVPRSQLRRLGVDYGLKVVSVTPESAFALAGVEPGVVLTHAEGIALRTPADLLLALQQAQGAEVLLEARRPDGRRTYYRLSY